MDQKTKDYIFYRTLEIIPGALVWFTLIAAILLSFFKPLWGIYFIIVFDTYWLLRVTYLLMHMIISWTRFRKDIKVNWRNKLVEDFSAGEKNWRDYWHVIFLPTSKEPYEVVEDSFESLRNSDYDTKKFILVLAGEQNFEEQFDDIQKRIVEKYSEYFHKIIVTLHPNDLEGELTGKGSNLFWAARKAKEYIDELGLDYKKIIASSFDIDTRPHQQYFSYLTHKFLSHENPYRVSFQPLTLYHNNIWESDLVTRIVANSTTFWLLTDLARSERLFTFSSHSMSWQMLVDVNFWQNNIVTEDTRIFLQALMHYDGHYAVEPMYMTVSMDTVYMGKLWQSLINQYKQIRRWAWGVEHFPYMAWHFMKNKRISRKTALIYLWNQTEGVYSWATAPLLIFLMGHLPLYFASQRGETSALAQAAPEILSALMTAAILGLVATAFLSVYILPKKEGKPWRVAVDYGIQLFQWLLFPITFIIFGSLPAIDAQTRLMLGKYMGFWVTPKARVAKAIESKA